METARIKVKVDGNELESEGPVEIVQAQFEAFRELVSKLAGKSNSTKSATLVQVPAPKDDAGELPHIPIDKILHLSGRIVSLTAIPKSATDAALLIMLGQKDLRNNVTVTGQEIGDGLALSGREVPRVDRIMRSE